MRKILISTFIFINCYAQAQTISNTKHDVMYYVSRQEDILVVKNKSKQLLYFFKDGNELWETSATKPLASIQEGELIFVSNKLSGSIIGEDKITDKDHLTIGYIYKNFGYCIDANKNKVAYFDTNVDYKLTVLLIYFLNQKQ